MTRRAFVAALFAPVLARLPWRRRKELGVSIRFITAWNPIEKKVVHRVEVLYGCVGPNTLVRIDDSRVYWMRPQEAALVSRF